MKIQKNKQLNIPKPTNEEKERGHSICECGSGVILHKAGFDIDLHMCAMCKQMVADRDEFFKFNDGVRAMSK